MTNRQIGRPRACVDELPSYRPGKGAAQAEAEHGITGAIKLASNENPMPPLESILADVHGAMLGINRYPDHRASALREALAGVLGVDAAQVTVGNGSSGLLQQLYFAYVDPGDEVLFPWRSFEVYPVFTKLMAGRPVQVPLRSDLGYDLPAVAAAITDRTKLIMLATPNNPTGLATPVAELRGLLVDVPASVVVVIDEAYREFLDPRFGDPVADLLPEFPNVVVTRTFSKAHGLAGLRVGYAVGDPEVISTVDKTMLPFSVSVPAQAAALSALAHADEIIDRVHSILAERERVTTELSTAGWTLPDHQANFVWLALGERTDQIGVELERRGVVVRPFSGEGIRVTIGSPEENDRFLATLAEVATP